MTATRSNRRVIILGALSAMAEETCRLLAAQGASLALIGRNNERLEAVAQDLTFRGAALITTQQRDLSDARNADQVLLDATNALGGIDAILIFYGYLGDQSLAVMDENEAHKILAINFSSAAQWVLAGARLLERDGAEGAVILSVTSVAGDRGRRSNFVYGAAKGGLSVLLQGLSHRFAGQSKRLRAVAVKAGFVDTPMTDGMEKGGALWTSPKTISRHIIRAMDGKSGIVYAPSMWRWIMLAIRLLPSSVFNRLNL